jgi:hypothetical protein
MARVVATETDEVEIKRLAQAIVGTQSREIREMNEWRSGWYGGPSPARDVPNDGDRRSGPREEHEDGHSARLARARPISLEPGRTAVPAPTRSGS